MADSVSTSEPATAEGCKALICGLAGTSVNDAERRFIAEHRPWGFIVFARNVENPQQLRALTDELRALSNHTHVPILVDQEGGRVQRLRPPHWFAYPTARALGALAMRDAGQGARATWLLSRLHAFDLEAVGIKVDCLPVLDVPSPDGHDVIGDRAYSSDPTLVSALGRAACDGLLAGGVQPVIKHIPGHGRASADSHHELPVVHTDLDTLRATDFAPFVALKDVAMAMTAHVIYSAIDTERCATLSPTVLQGTIRGELGYDGLVMCDDITMGALSGSLTQRTAAMCEAGCDVVLHCTGRMDEMEEVAAATPYLTANALRRADLAMQGLDADDGMDEQAARDEFAALMGGSTQIAAADPTDYGPTA